MKVSYYSLGCKVNLYESEAIINEFLEQGFLLGEFNEVCDVYIINTCTVTSTSDQKSRKMIRQAAKRNPSAVVAVMGCYSQLNSEQVKEIEGVDIILGTSNRHLLFPYVMNALQEKNQIIKINQYKEIKDYEEIRLNRYNDKTRGFIKIQDGCNNFCSYCRIPYARGASRSRNPQDVISEIKHFSDQGMKEIVLSGINTGTYGLDLENTTFAELLQEVVNKVENLGRIRISSIEATEITDDLLAIISKNKEHFCDHFHIPLQGGANAILRRMSRKYDTNYYLDKINQIRAVFPDANITTDIMVGFVGEEVQDFEEAKEFVKRARFGEMHVFPYSKRPGTKAYEMSGHVDEITKRIRVNELLEINQELALEYRKSFVGKTLKVIVEKNVNGKAFGHTENYLQLEFLSQDAKQGDLINVMVTDAFYPVSKGVKV